jgi:hypothetical protein
VRLSERSLIRGMACFLKFGTALSAFLAYKRLPVHIPALADKHSEYCIIRPLRP